MDDIDKLLEAASNKTEDNFNLRDSEFDVFLKESLYSEDDLSKRVFLVDLFEMYAYWYYKKHKDLPSVMAYSRHSGITKVHTVRGFKHETNQFVKSLKCSTVFKITYLKFKEENPTWSKKLKNMQTSRRASKTKNGKVWELTPSEKSQLESLLSSLPLAPDSLPK